MTAAAPLGQHRFHGRVRSKERHGSGPADVDVLVGLDVGKTDHHATSIDPAGQPLLSRPVANAQAALEALLDAAGEHGTPALVIDQPGSIALPLAASPRSRRGSGLHPRAGDAPRR